MYRYVIALAAVVMVVAAGAVAWVTLVQPGRQADPPGPVESAPEAVEPSEASVPDEQPPTGAEANEATRETEPPVASNDAPPEVAKPPGPAITLRSRSVGKPGSIVAQTQAITPEMRNEHYDRMRRYRQQAMYRLPASYGVMRLEQATDPELRPADDVLEQIAQVREQMQIKAKASLEDLVAEEEQLRNQMQQLYRKRAAVQSQLDAEYKDMLRTMLTAEQMEVVEGRRKAYTKPVTVEIYQRSSPTPPPGAPDSE